MSYWLCFADFSAGFFSSFSWGKSAQKSNPPENPLQNLPDKTDTTKLPQHISGDLPGQGIHTVFESNCNDFGNNNSAEILIKVELASKAPKTCFEEMLSEDSTGSCMCRQHGAGLSMRSRSFGAEFGEKDATKQKSVKK